MLNNNSIASLLYCDEDPLVSTTPPPLPPPSAASNSRVVEQQQQALSVLPTVVGDVAEDHLKELLEDHMARQRFYAPTCRAAYLEHLLLKPQKKQQQQQQGSSSAPPPEAAIIPPPGTDDGSVSCARSRGVHYIIYAFGRLGLTVGTVFNAVNYLDRFLSINCHLRWEAWMVELVSVACLSIACKLDEVNIPSLHHLQMEEVMSHSFLPATVRDMELTLLKALQWRLACVTPYSFLLLLLPAVSSSSQLTPLPPRTTTTTARRRCTRLLIRSLTEPSFIQFDSSVIASSALRCVALLEDDHRRHTPPVQDHEADEYCCFRMMETLYASCCSESDSNWNWNTTHRPCLELMETAGGGGGGGLTNNSRPSTVSRRRLFGASPSASAPQGR